MRWLRKAERNSSSTLKEGKRLRVEEEEGRGRGEGVVVEEFFNLVF